MSRDLFGEFGDFQTSSTSTSHTPPATSTTSNNTFLAFPPAATAPQHQSNNGNAFASSNNRPKSQNFDDLLGLFDTKPASSNTNNNVLTAPSPGPMSPPLSLGYTPSSPPPPYQFSNFNSISPPPPQHPTIQSHAIASRPAIHAVSSEAIISGLAFNSKPATPQPPSTTLFSASPIQNAVEDDDDFGDFAEEPLPSSNPSFGPFSNYASSPPPQPAAPVVVRSAQDDLLSLASPSFTQPEPTPAAPSQPPADDEFGNFIFTPRIPTPPPQPAPFNLSSNMTNPNHAHPQQPPPHLHQLLPVLTTTLLSPTPFLSRLKPLSYPAKQRLLSDSRVKDFFTAVVHTAHVTGRLIASKKIRPRRTYATGGSGKRTVLQTSKPAQLKDEREIAECVREYSEAVGSLRAVVRGMGLVVPEISVDMPIVSSPASFAPANAGGKGKKLGPNGNGSNNAKDEFCWLCGLNSLDRIPKLKEDGPSDAMGLEGLEREKLWVNGWGHRSCKNWWEGCGMKEVKA